MVDVYRTIHAASKETLYKEKGSKFFGYAFPVTSEDEVQLQLDFLKKKHSSARHFCYAWQIGVEAIRYRTNDDGEPNNSAGIPIYGQIQSFQVTNILVVSVRYFGGTKLGVGGLIQAYKTSAQITLEISEIIEKTINDTFLLTFSYEEMNLVMRLVKEHNLEVTNQQMEINCQLTIEVRKKDSLKIESLLSNFHKVQYKKLKTEFL